MQLIAKPANERGHNQLLGSYSERSWLKKLHSPIVCVAKNWKESSDALNSRTVFIIKKKVYIMIMGLDLCGPRKKSVASHKLGSHCLN